MKQTNTQLLRRLKQYSALAVPLVSVAGFANAQVIYTDLNPDVVLNLGDSIPLDLNNDGTIDFQFKVTKYGQSDGWYFAGLIPYPASGSNLNAFAGYTNTFGGGPSIYGFPSMFSNGKVIDASLPWIAPQQLLWVSSSQSYYFYAGMLSNYYGTHYGQWSGAIDKYLALRFSPDGSALDYAWVRCDLDTAGIKLTLKDFAYEATPGNSIIAGAGQVSGISNVNSNDFTVYGYEGMVYVMVKDGKYDHVRLRITNMLGQDFVDEMLTNSESKFDLNKYGKGIYMVTLLRDDQMFSRKISFK